MNNFVKGLVGVVILIVIWAGISYFQSNVRSDKSTDNTKQTDASCNTSSGGG